MKKFSIVICCIALILFLFCCQNARQNKEFENPYFQDSEKFQNVGFGLILFLSPNSCPACLSVVGKLNDLAKGVPILGVVDRFSENEIREMQNQFKFPLKAITKVYKTITPLLSPSLVAVDRKGRILMILPGLPEQESYIEKIVWELSTKAFF